MRKLSLLTVFSVLATFSFAQSQNPTFSSDVAKIIYTNCTSCHRQGAIAPFSLESYQDVYNNRFAIVKDVQNQIMPPWSPNSSYTHFNNERKLTTDEIGKIVSWVSGGAAEGERAKAPAVPLFNDQSQLKNVDFSSRCSKHTVTKNEDDFEFFALPSGLAIDAYIKQMELVPLNKKIVHHIFVFVDSTGDFKRFVDDGGANHINGNNYISGGNLNQIKLIGGWLPGGSYSTVPDNLGIRVPKNSFYIVQIHYAPGSNGQSDATQLNIKYGRTSELRDMMMKPLLDNVENLVDGPLMIPAGEVRTFHEKFTVPSDISLISITPHMHKIGTRLKVYAYRPTGQYTGDTIRLIDDKWDFHWQGMYTFPTMVHLKANDILFDEGTYENTSDNSSNPNSPPINMFAGTSTLTEMLQVFFCYVPYKAGDENISLANTTLPSPDAENTISADMYPNPVSTGTILNISVDPKAVYNVDLFSADGRKINTYANVDSHINIALPLPTLPQGLYFVRVSNDNTFITKKLEIK
jgi:hypothetical protein